MSVHILQWTNISTTQFVWLQMFDSRAVLL
uniref:Uncharacterized protein n=1 Tax=Rhizophora mucronata TaxID=61149 RepID=A0A2P2N9S6_RHIMU